MEDDGRAKRLKSSEDDVDLALRERIAVLESEIAQFRSGTRGNQAVAAQRGRIAELEYENEQLRRHGRREEGHHEVLPLVVTTVVTVDLSRIDSSIITQISSFLGTSRELLNLGLTGKSFGWRQPPSTLNWSLAEEVARQEVCSRATDSEISSLPRYVSGTTTWLSILYRFEHLLVFDVLLGQGIEHRNGDRATVHTTGPLCTAVTSNCVMRTGSHFAEFEIVTGTTGTPYIGIVRPMPGLDRNYGEDCFFIGKFDLYPDFLQQRSDEWGVGDIGNVHACEYYCQTGKMNCTDWEYGEHGVTWEGRESCESGDTIGMLLNLDEGSLTVYKSNRRLGVMKDGLSGSYCWHVGVWGGSAVTIKRGEPP